jgi:hypothetical protein
MFRELKKIVMNTKRRVGVIKESMDPLELRRTTLFLVKNLMDRLKSKLI